MQQCAFGEAGHQLVCCSGKAVIQNEAKKNLVRNSKGKAMLLEEIVQKQVELFLAKVM